MRDDSLSIDEQRGAPPHDHVVHVYADDVVLMQELARFITSGLTLGESVVVVVTSEHRATVATLLRRVPAHSRETVVFLDAAKTLGEIMVDGTPDSALVEATVGPIFEAAARGGRPIRVFGEMVALLWAEGNIAGALALETLWNDLAAERQFFLMCAYPLTSLDESPLRDVDALRELHSRSWLLGLSTQYQEKDTNASAGTAHLLFPVPMSATVSIACQFAIRTLNEWEVCRFVDAASAITSELAANAVLHARTAYRLTLSRTSSSLRIAVEDSDPCLLDARRGHRPDGTTHGLAMVKASSSRCGYSLAADGKTVWAELGMSAQGRE